MLNIKETEDRKVRIEGEIKDGNDILIIQLTADISTALYDMPSINTNIVNKEKYISHITEYQKEISEFNSKVFAKQNELFGGVE